MKGSSHASRIVLLVLLILAVVSLVIVSGLLVIKKTENVQCSEACVSSQTMLARTSTGTSFNESIMLEDGVAVIPVVPLHWNGETKTYDITLTVGSSEVTAAFDTGSAGTILRTPACQTCKGAKVYLPADEGVKDATQTPCRSSISYVSQTNVLQMYSDTVTFRRRLAKQGSDTSPSQTLSLLRRHEAAPLVITGFPIGGMVESYGNHDSVNVFGISGVKSVNQAKTGGDPSFPTSACTNTATSNYESALLHSIAAVAPHAPLRWSIKFGADRARDGATVALGTAQAYTGHLISVPLVRRLPDAPSEMVGTPWRYYVIEVLAARHASSSTAILDFPRHLIIDTATTQFMIPGSTSPATLSTHGLVITLNDEARSEMTWPGKISGTAFENAQDYDTRHASTPLFASMPDTISREFSSSSRGGSVGILGALAMRGRYIEFLFSDPDTDARTVSFAFA